MPSAFVQFILNSIAKGKMPQDDKLTDQFLQDEEEREQRSRLVLQKLLDRQRERAGHIFALRMAMGITESYITTVPLSWVANKILFAADIPLFDENDVDKDSKTIDVNQNTVDILQQRQPDWRRQLPMSIYLAARDNHKFPPLLIVGYQNWAYDDKSDKWGIDRKALAPSVPVESLDSNGFFLDLHDQQTQYYAFDGQHRLMAIRGLKELLNDGCLHPRNADGKRKSSGEVNLNDVVKSIMKRCQTTNPEETVQEQEIRESLRARMNEDIGIEIIPAIQRGETREDATNRLRQILVDVNEQAKPPSKGDNILLDNNNGFRFVARRIMVSHVLLNDDKTQIKGGQLFEKSPCYTTLPKLVEIAEEYLGRNRAYKHWLEPVLGDKSYGYTLPAQSEIKKGIASLMEYFDALLKLPSHEYFARALPENRNKLRAAPSSKEDDSSSPSPEIRDNILFRPIVQPALAGAIGAILAKSETPPEQIKQKLHSIAEIIARQEKKGMLKLRDRKSPWFGVMCDTVDHKMRKLTKHQDLCRRMFVYLLHGMEKGALEELRNDFALARKTSGGDGDDAKGISLEGKEVPLDKIRLPHPWRS